MFDENTDIDQIINALKLATKTLQFQFSTETIAEQDWVRATQAQFDPIKITDNLWIVPTWHTAPNKDAINIVLDPGLAFGTGSHPTTSLCLEWLTQQQNMQRFRLWLWLWHFSHCCKKIRCKPCKWRGY